MPQPSKTELGHQLEWDAMTADGSGDPSAVGSSSPAPMTRGRKEWSGDHQVNLRLSIPLFFRRKYVVLLIGEERRRPDRRAEERSKNPLLTSGNVTVCTFLGLLCALAAFPLFQIIVVMILEFTRVVIRG